MARVKMDLKRLSEKESELRKQLAQLKKQQRLAERREHGAHLQRVAELAEKFGILNLPDTVLAAEFKRIAAEHHDAGGTEKTAEVDTTETTDTPHSGVTEHAETAAAEDDEGVAEPRKRGIFGR